MKIKEFTELEDDSVKLKNIEREFEGVVTQVGMALYATFQAYRTAPPEVGYHFGKGPLYQMCDEIMREFIRKQ